MSALNPANVPAVGEPRWIIASKEECSLSQQQRLRELLRWEGLEPGVLFGDGFSSMQELSRWAVHWAIDLLEAAMMARSVERQRVEYESAKEQAMKSMIANHYRQQMRAAKRHHA
ncbi:MAG TPA: hypothetical protein VIG24_06250 [Acidimicrobiia bacterium]